MARIETKFSIGDRVYAAGITTERRHHNCPDCLGSRKWSAKSPAGGEYDFACPRCTSTFQNDRDLSLAYTVHVPAVSALTIGSFEHNTAPDAYNTGTRYMCRETGIGSGSVYAETDLFFTEAEARAAAEAKAASADTSVGWVAKLYDKTLRLSDYQLDNLKIKAAREERSRIGSMFWSVEDLFSTIEEAESKTDILEAVEDYKNYSWPRDKERFTEEFATGKSSVEEAA